MAAAVAPRTILDAMIACGVDNVELFLRETQAQRLVDGTFDDSFASCLDITFKKLDNHFKTYPDLSAAHGQIYIRPGTRKNIKAFVQWTRDKICL
jgi:hypothetical protein